MPDQQPNREHSTKVAAKATSKAASSAQADNDQDSVQIEGAGLVFVVGFTALMLFQLCGEISVRLIDVAIPGPVVGLVYMLVFLGWHQKWRGTEPQALTQVSSNLLAHLSLLFVPAGVGVMLHFEKIVQQWQPVILALLVGSCVTLAVTAWSLKLLIRLAKLPEPE